MPKIQVARQGPPVQVDDFPNAVEVGGGKAKVFVRSCEGALYFRPGSVVTISEDELRHVKTTPAHAALASRIVVLPEPKLALATSKTKPPKAKLDDGKGTKKVKGSAAS